MPAEAAEFLVAAIRSGENVIVAGDHYAGKTTLPAGDVLRRHPAS